jgi:hypothetical protein
VLLVVGRRAQRRRALGDRRAQRHSPPLADDNCAEHDSHTESRTESPPWVSSLAFIKAAHTRSRLIIALIYHPQHSRSEAVDLVHHRIVHVLSGVMVRQQLEKGIARQLGVRPSLVGSALQSRPCVRAAHRCSQHRHCTSRTTFNWEPRRSRPPTNWMLSIASAFTSMVFGNHKRCSEENCSSRAGSPCPRRKGSATNSAFITVETVNTHPWACQRLQQVGHVVTPGGWGVSSSAREKVQPYP